MVNGRLLALGGQKQRIGVTDAANKISAQEKEGKKERLCVITCLGQASGHRQLAAVITDMPWELGVTPLGRCNY